MRVLASPNVLPANHYIGLLYGSLKNLGVVVRPMTRLEVLRGADLCHVHWPDHALMGNSILTSFYRVFRFFSLVAWCKLRWHTKVVWTVHNLEPHERTLPFWWRRLFYRLWFYFVDGCIFLSEESRHAFEIKYQKNFPYAIIPHGHYCDLYENVLPEKGLEERLGIEPSDFVFGHYGQIRDYKNVPHLIREFSKLTSARYKLIIAGKVSPEDGRLRREIESLALTDERIHFLPGFLSDATMKGLYEMTNWAVLPYKDILNSGSALLALSLGCPVLVPNFPTMVELQSQTGSQVVRLILNSDLLGGLRECIEHTRTDPKRSLLKVFEWSVISTDTYDFYTKICQSK